MVGWLFSWEVAGVVIFAFVGFALGVLAMNDYKLAKTFFLLASLDATVGVIVWGVRINMSPLARNSIVFIVFGTIGVLLGL